ncbi:hypothetical protein PoB_003672000 [Plakobranchus ocellatus]|uniref:AP2/ERF domain-containing protein n=1 Tax=Plakobranchus ocellatus TaxID=259542 RepID=A0AAV4ATI4_9GAST|nr:hypothetical protein PoB_003672000 [Plakobranchus ocellatus]
MEHETELTEVFFSPVMPGRGRKRNKVWKTGRKSYKKTLGRRCEKVDVFRVPERAKGFYDDALMAAEAKNEDTDERDDMCSSDESESFV